MVKHDTGYSYIRPGRIRTYSDWLLPIGIFVGALALYLKTMALSVFWDDSAAFATSNFILGLPHSPSFPLYTLFGRIFSLLPNMTPAYAANLMSAFFAAGSVACFYILIKQFADVPVIMSSRKARRLGNRPLELGRAITEAELRIVEADTISKPAIVILPCLIATALFGIILPVWLAAVRAEVYSLHLVLILTACIITFRATSEQNRRLFYLGIWIYALTFANHPLLALAFAPAFVYLFLANFSNLGIRPITVGMIILLFIASFSVYFYLPIRSAFQPAINWGRPDNLNSFVAAITRSSDLSNLAQITITPDYMMRLRKIGAFMSGQIGWPLLGLTLVGLIGIFKVSRRVFLAFPLAIIGNLAIVLWVADFTPRNYDLINYLAPLTAFILVVGIAGTLYLVRTRVVTGQAAIAMSLLIGVFAYLGWGSNYNQANLAGVNAPEELSREILKDVPNGSLLIVAEDNVLLPLWYSAYAESSAAKINIVSAGAMINPQYRKQLTVNYPSLIYPVDFTNELSGQADRLAESLCRLNAAHRDVLIQFGVPGIKANEVEPFGIIFKYVGENGTAAEFNPDSYRIQMQLADRLLSGNRDEIQTIDFVGRWLFNAAVYYDRVNQPEIAWKLFNRALDVDKTNVEMRVRLASALAKGGKYKEALQYISQALEIDPGDKVCLELGHRIVQAIEKSGPVAAND